MPEQQIAILGAGMVGVTSALALQAKGFDVLLIDKSPIASETSFGNAGMITPSSLIPLNNPRLVKQLPSLLKNDGIGFRYKLSYVMQQLNPLLHFLIQSKQSLTQPRIHHLFQLIEHSRGLHQQLATLTAGKEILRPTGWLKLYREPKSYLNARYERDIYQQFDVLTETLEPQQIQALEPVLSPIYHRAFLIREALSVANPRSLVKSYATLFEKRGGKIAQREVQKIKQIPVGWCLKSKDEEDIHCEQIVLAAGPWSKKLLQPLGLKLPMIFERGAHREYNVQDTNPLQIPIHDVDGGYVMTPVAQGVRLTCGVELNHLPAKYSPVQLDLAEGAAREAMLLPAEASTHWQGARPTLPDSLPVIGQTKKTGLWLNTGHQHIGFSTGPACAELLAELMHGSNTTLDGRCFSPARFKL